MASSATSPAARHPDANAILGRLPASGLAHARRPMAAAEALHLLRAERLAVPRIAVGVHAVVAVDACRLVIANGTQLTFDAPRPETARASHVLAAAWTLGEGLSAAVSREFAARRYVRAQMLDDLGTALLFRLAERLFARAASRAARSGTSLGSPLAPGDTALGLSMLAPVLDLARAGRAGIRLVEAGAMWPPKSGAAVALVGTDLSAVHSDWDCTACRSADGCRWRPR